MHWHNLFISPAPINLMDAHENNEISWQTEMINIYLQAQYWDESIVVNCNALVVVSFIRKVTLDGFT